MTNIIDIIAEREKRKGPEQPAPIHGAWMFAIDVFAPLTPDAMVSARLKGFNPDDGLEVGDRMRSQAFALETIARLLRDQAQQHQPDKDGHLMMVTLVWEGSRVWTWASDKISNNPPKAQRDWLKERLVDAFKLVIEP